jgi:hypothetical protein
LVRDPNKPQLRLYAIPTAEALDAQANYQEGGRDGEDEEREEDADE